jgi:hypothetical protein
MTSQTDKETLERLYRDQAPIEPPAGLDRMIRARAEQALEQDRRVRPLPWMGGVATAAVLVLAVAVVIQMPEPAPELPMSETTTARSAPPTAQQDSMLQTPAELEQSEPDLDRAKVTGSRARAPESAAAFSEQAAPEPAAPARQSMNRVAAEPNAERAVDPVEEAREELRSAPPPEAAEISELLADGETSPCLELEDAIADGNAELAKALLERLREEFPDDARLEEYRRRVLEIEAEE